MAKSQDVTDQEEAESSGFATAGPSSTAELSRVLRQLSVKLALPEELLPSFMNEDKPREALAMYRNHAYSTLQEISGHTRSPAWAGIGVEERADLMFEVSRLYGVDQWTDDSIRGLIDEISSTIDRPAVANHILSRNLRRLFSAPHPMLSDSSRALQRPVGGSDAQMDFHDTATLTWKSANGWGCHNILAWCCSQLSGEEIQDHVGVILPPTLTMMDDWEAPWRGRGVRALSSWVDKVDAGWMKRMGMDKLLLDSLIHTLSLHAAPPLAQVLHATLKLLGRVAEGEKRAKRLEEIMEKGIVQGWMYAKSGAEGRPVLIQIAQDLERICEEMRTGVARWLKTIIPNQLNPLQFSPTPVVLPHFQANLQCLLKVMVTLRDTERIGRWRGKILHILSVLWTQLDERRLADEPSTSEEAKTRELVVQVIQELVRECPTITKEELPQLEAMDARIFGNLVSAVG